jgi:hypothetical protein
VPCQHQSGASDICEPSVIVTCVPDVPAARPRGLALLLALPPTTTSNWPVRPFSSVTGVSSASRIRVAKLAAFSALVPQVSQ